VKWWNALIYGDIQNTGHNVIVCWSTIIIVYFQMQYFDRYRFSLTNIVGEFNVAVASRMEKMPPWTHKEEDTS
jgi:hypothetical protein